MAPKTACRFLVKGVFTIRARGYVLHGEIVDGVAEVGMLVRPPGERLSRAIPVDGVEALDFRHENRAEVALVFRDIDLADTRLWRKEDLVGNEVHLFDGARG